MSKDTIVSSSKLTAIGNAIRAKGGTSAQLTLDAMPQAITDLPSGGSQTTDRLGDRMDSSCAGAIVNNKAKSVYGYAYRSCKNITSVKATHVTAIQMHAFDGCSGIKKYDFGNSGSSDILQVNGSGMGEGWFYNNSSVEAFIIRYGKVATLTGNPNDSSKAYLPPTIYSGSGFIYVPAALVESYKQATNWSIVADQIRAIEDYPEICGE